MGPSQNRIYYEMDFSQVTRLWGRADISLPDIALWMAVLHLEAPDPYPFLSSRWHTCLSLPFLSLNLSVCGVPVGLKLNLICCC